METELWPNFLRAVRREGIPIVLANGRISPGSYRGYRLVRRFLRRVLDDICCFGMQTASDAERIVALGADARRVEVTGNVKFDGAVEGETAEADRLSRVLKLAPTDLPFIAGSTHSGEDAIVMDAFARLRAAYPSMVLIVAPRHPERPERVREIEAVADERALPCIRRSALAERGRGEAVVIIVDTFGELASAYRLGQIIFVGGSLVPVGGHNVLEAAVYGRPVLFGPHMHNFQAIGDLMRAEECGIEVKGRDDLIRCVEALLENPERYRVLGERARALVLRNRGALARTVEIVERYLAE
jgi:3-deoxy-D-manno-octulosonic-acid transferase